MGKVFDECNILADLFGFQDKEQFKAVSSLSATLTYQMYMSECETFFDKYELFKQLYKNRFIEKIDVQRLPKEMIKEFELMNDMHILGESMQQMLEEQQKNIN